MAAKHAPDRWIDQEIYLDLGGDEGYIDKDGTPIGLTLKEVSDRGILVRQRYEDIEAPTFYPWRSIKKIIGPDELSQPVKGEGADFEGNQQS